MTDKKVPFSLLLTIATLFLLNSPQSLTSAEPYETVDKFCNQKNVTEDREFCLKVLKSDPRSATAKDNIALLLIADDLAIKQLIVTKNYLVNSYKKESKLKDCLDAYNWGIGELKIIPAELREDPATASYDALMASDAMNKCKGSLEKDKISDAYVLGRQPIDLAYVRLCVDISMTVG